LKFVTSQERRSFFKFKDEMGDMYGDQ
jgi:hypothetical protein